MQNLKTIESQFLDTALELSVFLGWNDRLIDTCCSNLCISRAVFSMVFKNNLMSLSELFFTRVDTAMENAIIQNNDWRLQAIHLQVYNLLVARFNYMIPYKEAIAKMLYAMSMPWNLFKSSDSAWRAADKIWQLVEHSSAGFDYYTRRAILASVYVNSLLYFVTDNSNDSINTYDFIKRQLKCIGKVGKLKNQILRKVKM